MGPRSGDWRCQTAGATGEVRGEKYLAIQKETSNFLTFYGKDKLD